MFDIETEDWTTFVMGGITKGPKGKDTKTYDDEGKFVDALLRLEGRVWAHNMGRFDGLWLLDRVRERGLKADVVTASSRIITFRVGKTEFADSWALAPMPLKKFGGKEETGLPCRCESGCTCSEGCFRGDGCGGYCSISRKMGRAARERLRAYLVSDCRFLWGALRDLEVFACTNDFDLTLTIGSAAWSTVHRTLGIPKAAWRGAKYHSNWMGATYEGFGQGYYGGRTQVFRPKLKKAFHADVNSMYPAQLAGLALPYGEPFASAKPGKDFSEGKSGFYRARVKVPDMFIPPLPVRVIDQAGQERVAYPTGRFEGVWTGLELGYAETCAGVKIEKVTRGTVFPEERVLFKDWIDRLWSLRAKAGKDTPMGRWLKLFMNSLYGKFASKPERARFKLNPKVEELKAQDTIKCQRWCGVKCRGRCGADYEVEKGSGLWKARTYYIPPCAHIEWGAYVTAGARIQLHEHLTEGGQTDGTDAAYCDTDSVISARERKWGVGAGLGELLLEGTVRDFEAIAPKTYTYRKGKDRHVKAKGVGLPQYHWAEISEGKTVTTKRLRGFVTGGKKGLFFARDEMGKTAKLAADRDGAYGDRVLDGEVTRPRNVKEFKKVLS